jgi:hypothetical protein
MAAKPLTEAQIITRIMDRLFSNFTKSHNGTTKNTPKQSSK